jgi:hypothetical protein
MFSLFLPLYRYLSFNKAPELKLTKSAFHFLWGENSKRQNAPKGALFPQIK